MVNMSFCFNIFHISSHEIFGFIGMGFAERPLFESGINANLQASHPELVFLKM